MTTTYTMNEYLNESERTMSSININPDLDLTQLTFSLYSLDNPLLDDLKKFLFYGKKNDKILELSNPTFSISNLLNNIDKNDKERSEKVLHGIIGTITESQELASLLLKTLSKPIDETNLLEEIGDILWYLAAILREYNYTFEDAAYVNIKKLKTRYPNKFSSKDAISRDLERERKILEEGTKSATSIS